MGTYSIRTKDGIVINNIPDDIPEDDPSLKARVAQIRAQNAAAEPEIAQKQTGTTGSRAAGILARGAIPALVGTGAGTLMAGPIGGAVGSVAVPAADLLAHGYNALVPEKYEVGIPSTAIQHGLTSLGLPEPQSTTERVIEAAGGGVGGLSNLPALTKLATTAATPVGRGVAQALSQEPVRQAAVAAPSAAAGQLTYEYTDNPYLALLASGATGAAGGIGAGKGGITKEQLAEESSQLFDVAKNSGINLKTKPFQANMKNIVSGMREEGYTPTANMAKLDAAIKELTTSSQPKDFVELKALRTMIANAQASADPSEQRLAGILKDKFDDYVLNIPQRDINKGDTELGMQAWADARNAYSRLKKAEIFEDIKSRAEMNATRYTQSGTENALVADLRNLANNKKKMRLFTPEEQQSIRDAVKGGKVQNVMRYLGKYAPTSVIPTAGGAYVGSMFGGTPESAALGAATVAGVGTGARIAATKMREAQLNKLIQIMRHGGQLPSQFPTAATTGLRGLISESE